MTRLITAITALVAFSVPAIAFAGGGAVPETPRPGPTKGWVTLRDGEVTMRTQVGTLAGGTFTPSGLAGAAKANVVIERLDRPERWTAVAYARAGLSGKWSARWKAKNPGRFTLRVRSAAADGTPTATVTVYRRSRATWFGGPGHIGESTACGKKLALRTLGVAHRSLPCGTMVEIAVGTRSLTVPVIDRGPYRRGYDWDLTWEAARRLRMPGLATIGYLAL